MSDIEIKALTLEDSIDKHKDAKCREMLRNKLQCIRKPEYKVSDGTYLCEHHYQLLVSTKVGERFKVRH